jgi:TetR/AcrR family transcriptional repressor of nem operon
MARPRTYTREEVLRRATNLFAQKGYEGAHLAELVEVTGLNRFSLYKEFGGKEGLFQSALDGYLEWLAAVSVHLQRDPPGLANLRSFYTALLAADFPYGCLAVNTIREKHLVPPAVFTTIEKFASSTEEGFRRNLVGARASGELPPETDVDTLAKFLTAADMGLITYEMVSQDRADRARIVGVIMSLLGLDPIVPAGPARGRARRRRS